MRYLPLLFLLTLLSCASEELLEDKKSPNILWIVTEDLSPILPPYGDSTVLTPNVSRLASEGVVFEHCFSPSGVCAPSRAALATGCYPTRIGANHMRTGPWFGEMPQQFVDRYRSEMAEYGADIYQALPPEGVVMMSEVLRRNGYYCTNNAKQDYQMRAGRMAWDENSRTAHWKNRGERQPFFSIFNIEVTHESRVWAKADDPLLVDENLDVPVPPYLPTTDSSLIDIRRVYSNIIEMDRRIGELLQELEDAGELENTIVWFYGDHGGPLPRQKRLLYDSGLRIPLIIRYPDQAKAGSREDRLVSFIDFAPTVMSQAGIKPQEDMDGKAFDGSYEQEDKDYVFAAADRFDETTDQARAVRDARYKYIRYMMPEKSMFLHVNYRDQMAIMRELYRLRDAGKLTPEQALWFRDTKPADELFDLQSDPHEINDLSSDPSYAEIKERLSSELDRWMTSFEDVNALPEKELLARRLPKGKMPITNVNAGIQENQLVISSSTPGASLGYKLIESQDTSSSWIIYESPVTIEKSQSVLAIAHRQGYEPSDVIAIQQ